MKLLDFGHQKLYFYAMGFPLGYKHSEESKEKMRKSHLLLGTRPPSWKGKKHSEETKKKIAVNQPLKTKQEIESLIKRNKDPMFWTDERRKKASKSGKERILNLEALKMTHQKNVGKKRTPEQRLKISLSLRGNKSYFWKGGISKEHYKIRNSVEYRLWREAVFKRDNWTCQSCEDRSKKGNPVVLQSHHIKSFVRHPELRFDVNNGLALCMDCHRKTDNYGFKSNLC